MGLSAAILIGNLLQSQPPYESRRPNKPWRNPGRGWLSGLNDCVGRVLLVVVRLVLYICDLGHIRRKSLFWGGCGIPIITLWMLTP